MRPARLLVCLLAALQAGPLSGGLPPAPGPPPPPPPEAVQLLLRSGGPVLVVDLGGTSQRWLKVLHPAAAIPLLMWRIGTPKFGSLPVWVQQAAAYLMAADDYIRFAYFLTYETFTAGPFSKVAQHLTRGKQNNTHVQFNSSAHIVVSYTSNVTITKLHPMEYRKTGKVVLKFLWKFHQHFRTVFMFEMEPGKWARYLGTNICKKLTKAEGDRWGFFLYPETQQSVEDLLSALEYQARNMHACPTTALFKTTLHTMNHNPYHKPRDQFWFNEMLKKLRSWAWHIEIRTANDLDLSLAAISVTPHAISESFFQFVDIIESSFYTGEALIVSPRAQPKPASTLLFRVFDWPVWLPWAGTLVAYSLAWGWVSGEPPAASLAAALRAFSSCGGAPQERVRAAAQRLQLAGALLASAVVVVSAYQGRLFSIMAEPERFSDIDTIEQAVESGFKYLSVHETMNKQFMDERALPLTEKSRATLEAFRAKIQSFKYIFPRLLFRDLHATGYNFGFVFDDHIVGILVKVYQDSFEHLHVAREPESSTGMVYYTRKNWPWRHFTNTFLMQFKEYGLYQNAQEIDYRYEVRGHGAERDVFDTEDSKEPRRFGMPDLIPHFLLLSAGLTVSSLAFLAELVQRYRSRRRLRRLRLGRAPPPRPPPPPPTDLPLPRAPLGAIGKQVA